VVLVGRVVLLALFQFSVPPTVKELAQVKLLPVPLVKFPRMLVALKVMFPKVPKVRL